MLAYISRHPHSRGLMIILHGWEGSSSSAYVLAAASYFYDRGFSICRLNLRDHGDSHHLNEGLFHGALLHETFDAVNALAQYSEDLPVYLLGFSLGANFALRIAIKHSQTPIKNLEQVFAVSPPLDPYKTTLAIDNGWAFYRKYFLNKWRRSLKKKQRLFPETYQLYRNAARPDLHGADLGYNDLFSGFFFLSGLFQVIYTERKIISESEFAGQYIYSSG